MASEHKGLTPPIGNCSIQNERYTKIPPLNGHRHLQPCHIVTRLLGRRRFVYYPYGAPGAEDPPPRQANVIPAWFRPEPSKNRLERNAVRQQTCPCLLMNAVGECIGRWYAVAMYGVATPVRPCLLRKRVWYFFHV